MSDLIKLIIISIFAQNIILSKNLGLCPLVGSTNSRKNAIGVGLCVLIVNIISSILIYFIYKYLLVPTSTIYLKTIITILLIATIVQVIDIILKKKFPSLHKSLGIYLPLTTTNCAVMGTVLLNITNNYNFIKMLVYTVSSSIGFLLVLYVFSTILERVNRNAPKCFKGYPIAFIIAGITSMIFINFGV